MSCSPHRSAATIVAVVFALLASGAVSCSTTGGTGSARALVKRPIGYVFERGCDAFPRGFEYVEDRFRAAGIQVEIQDRQGPIPGRFLVQNFAEPGELVDQAQPWVDFSLEDYLFAVNQVSVVGQATLPPHAIGGFTYHFPRLRPGAAEPTGFDFSFVFSAPFEASEAQVRRVRDDAIASTTVHELAHAFGIDGEVYDKPRPPMFEGHPDGQCVMWALDLDPDGELILTDPTVPRDAPRPQWAYADTLCHVCSGILRARNSHPSP